MPNPVTGLIIGGSQLLGGMMQADAAESAAQAQAGAAGEGIAEQRRQFDAIQQLLAPYIQAGTGAINQFQPFQQAGQQAFQLQQEIDKQYGRLGGFAGTGLGVSEALYRGGQASAVNQASQAGTLGSNVANLLAQQGAAQAGGQLAGAAPFANLLGLPLQMAGMNYGRTGEFGLPGFKGFGGFDGNFRSPVSGNGAFNNLFYASTNPISATGPQ
jgi:hypothetical protein